MHVGAGWHATVPVERSFDVLPLRLGGQISIGDSDQIAEMACRAPAET